MIRIRVMLAACSAALLAGCALTRPPEVETVMRLSVRFEPREPRATSPSVSVAPTQAGGFAAARRYAYVERDSPAVVRQAASLFWDEPPPVAVERALVDGLGARFASVAGPQSLVQADERITVRVERFEEVTGGGQPAQAVVAFEATTVGTGGDRFGRTRRYCAAAPIASAEPSARAAAFETALSRDIEQLVQDLSASASSVPSY
jgi:ABC-type uncharacterized transport system auxiliary subunit